MEKKYYKVGEKITMEVVISGRGCKGCFFDGITVTGFGCDMPLPCSNWNRKDKTNIIFKQIKNEE